MTLTLLVDAGPWLPVPPHGYGGIETVVATLVPELRRAGAEVVLATVAGSTLEADHVLQTLDEPAFRSIAAPYNQVSGLVHAHLHQVSQFLLREGGIDLVHSHVEVVGPSVMAAMGALAPPTVQTLHWDLRKHRAFYETFDGHGRVGFVAVSQSQLDRAPAALQAQTLAVVPLAVPPPEPMPGIGRGDHALVLARITADKAQDVAARVCLRAGMPLVLAGPVAGITDPEELRRRLRDGDARLASHPDVRYWVEQVAPLVDGERVRWIGGVGGEAKERLLRSAAVLLAPNRWAEPGATGVVEALVRGVPVVATPLGVLPSLVRDGENGFLGATEDDLADLVPRSGEIRPEACVASAAGFTPERMARSYLEVFERVADRTRSLVPAP